MIFQYLLGVSTAKFLGACRALTTKLNMIWGCMTISEVRLVGPNSDDASVIANFSRNQGCAALLSQLMRCYVLLQCAGLTCPAHSLGDHPGQICPAEERLLCTNTAHSTSVRPIVATNIPQTHYLVFAQVDMLSILGVSDASQIRRLLALVFQGGARADVLLSLPVCSLARLNDD